MITDEMLRDDAGTPLNPFDPARLRLAQVTTHVKQLVTSIPVRKPSREWWIRAHPSEEYRLYTMILELKDGNEIYLVDPTLWDALEGEPCCGPRLLVTCVNRQGTLFLWPLRQADASGKIDEWSQSALEACSLATDAWTRVTANVNRGAYDPSTPVHADLGVPKWPELSMEQILKIAFKNRHITDLNHPVLRNLRGER